MVDEDMAMKIATFRFGLIADFVTGTRLERGEKERLLTEKTARSYEIPGSQKTRVSRSTLLSWVAAYRKANHRIEGLMPKTRKDRGTYKKLDTGLRMAIKDLKTENPNYTVPTIIKKLRHAKVLGPADELNLASVYRFIRNEKLNEIKAVPNDRRRFEAAFPNEIWQCDVMHGPLVKMDSGPQRKAYLCAIMDDHSRLVVHAQFYLSEAFDSLKDCLKQAVTRRGLPSKFYVDNGACYKAHHLEQILASLGIALTHSRPYTPQGRGKIERWFRYVRQDFLPNHAHKPRSLTDLNEELEGWVDGYNGKVHSVTKMTPYDRFKQNLACVRPAPADLIDHFRKVEHRRVKRDRSLQLHGRHFEAPVGLIDRTVELRFHPETPDEVEIFFEGFSHGAASVLDPHVNVRVGRDWGDSGPRLGRQEEVTSEEETIPTGRLFAGNAEERPDEHGI